jgi:transposase
MKPESLFGLALGVAPPWYVKSAEFSVEEGRLDLYLDFERGAHFPCPSCGTEGAKPYDTSEDTWRHLNFFQYETYLHARVPRVECPRGCGVKRVEVAWARPDSGFTQLFEAFLMVLLREMPVARVAELVNEHDTRLWRVLHHYVGQARDREDLSDVRMVGVDETSGRRGHRYISVFVDMEKARAIFVTKGKDAEVVEHFKDDLEAHKGQAEHVQEVCCDMSPAYIAGFGESFPAAHLTFDKFHVSKVLSDAVDQVRREEQRERPELKRTRYLWLTNPDKLKQSQQAALESLTLLKLKTGRAYQLRLTFQDFWALPCEEAETFLRKWFFWATHSRLEPMRQAAWTIRRHWCGILRWFTSRINNGILEAINGLIQAAKARARGYRSNRNLIAMTYLIAGKLQLDLPT